jgi:hypothetical protein
MCDRSMRQTPCNRAQSSGSRFLAVGLLPLLRPRSFCQGDDTLVHFEQDLYPNKYRFWCNVHGASSEREEITLGATSLLSHAVTEFVFRGTNSPPVRNLAHQLSRVCA